MNELSNNTALVMIAMSLLWMIFTAIVVIVQNRPVAELAKSIREMRNDTRQTDLIEKAYQNANAVTQRFANLTRDILVAVGKLDIPGVDPIIDEAAGLMTDVSDGKPNVAPGAFDAKALQAVTPGKADTTPLASKL